MASAYATSADLAIRYDSNVLADLASDSGTPVVDLSADANITAALDDASGQIDAAIQVGEIYTVTDLTGLSGTAQSLIKRITCQLAMSFLIARRPEKYGEDYQNTIQAAEDYLDKLRRGVRLFPLAAQIRAGLPTIDGPTSLEYNRLNLTRDRMTGFYPHRKQSLPLGK